MKKNRLVLMAALLTASAGYSATLLNVDFESDTVGNIPTSSSAFVNPAPTAVNFVKVIDSTVNTAGTGNGVQFYDDSTSVGTRLEYNLPGGPVSLLRFDFSFSTLRTDGLGSSYINAAVATNNGNTGSSGSRFCSLRLYDNGTVRFVAGSSPGTIGSSIPVVTGTVYTVSMFVNDSANAIGYTDPLGGEGTVLAADSVAYWMNGVNYGGGQLQGGGTGISAGTNGLARVGFGTTTANAGLSYALDNLVASDIVTSAPPVYAPLPDGVLLLEDYENSVVGGTPTHNVACAYGVTVVTNTLNTSATGKAVQIYDNNTNAYSGLEYNIVTNNPGLSAARADFAFSWRNTLTSSSDGIYAGFGEYSNSTSRTLLSSSKRWTDLSLNSGGTVDFRSSVNGTNNGNPLVAFAANTVTIYANDYDSTAVSYTVDGTAYSLPANSVAYWLNGSMVMFGSNQYASIDITDTNLTTGLQIGSSEGNLGRFGFGSGTTALGLDYIFDNVMVSEIRTNSVYSLKVTSGGSGGLYTNGQQIAIAAYAPATGMTFDKWTGNTQYVASVTASNTTVTMPAGAVALAATYKAAAGYYTLTVTGGSGSGSYTNGSVVAIAADAPAPGLTFDVWIGDTQYVAGVSSSNTTVTMPAQDVALYANYKSESVILTSSAGASGTVTPASTNVVPGNSADFVITASNYYRIASLTTNGTPITGMTFDNSSTATNFTWSNVQAAGTVAATFTAQVVTNPAVSGANVPYSWLAGYGLTNYEADAAADQDGDGLKTWQEYIAGTDPTNAASTLKVAQTNRNTVTWSPVAGRFYSVYWSTNLVKGFTNLASGIQYPQGSYTNTTPDAKVNHYQVRVQLQ